MILPLLIGAALAAIVGLFAHLVGYDRDRSFYAAVLTVVGSMYVLFAVMGGGAGLFTEIGYFTVFAAMAAMGFRTSLWVVAAGLALHGVFDLVRHSYAPAPGAPAWWPAFCGAYDVVAAAGLAWLVAKEARKTR